MNIFKIAQVAPFYKWYTEEILKITNDYKSEIPHMYSPEILSEIAENFGDLTKEQLSKLTLEDLYVINYLKGGYHKLPILRDKSTISRLSGISAIWLNKAVKNFPNLLYKYLSTLLTKEVELNPRSYVDIPDPLKIIIPEKAKRSLVEHFNICTLNNWVSYREIPEDLRPMLSPQAKNYVIDTYANAFKDASGKGLELIPEDIKNSVIEIIESNKRIGNV